MPDDDSYVVKAMSANMANAAASMVVNLWIACWTPCGPHSCACPERKEVEAIRKGRCPYGATPLTIYVPIGRLVDCVLQTLTSLEFGLGRSGDGHRFAGARVTAGRGLALRDRESAKAHKANIVAFLESGSDGVENSLNSLAGICFGETSLIGDFGDKFVLIHMVYAPLSLLLIPSPAAEIRKTRNKTESVAAVKGKTQKTAIFRQF